MLVVRIPPEHMRLKVAAREVKEQQAVVIVIYGVIEERQPLLENHARLLEELVIDEYAVGPGFVVFLKTGGVEQAQLLRYVLDERIRLGQLLRGGTRVHVDGCVLNREVGRATPYGLC